MNSNRGIVYKIAHEFDGYYHLDFNDIVAEGNVGLVEAAHRFDESRGFTFATYGGYWIRARIMLFISTQSGSLSIGRNQAAYRVFWKARGARRDLEKSLGRDPTPEEVAKQLGVGTSYISALPTSQVHDIYEVGDELFEDTRPSVEHDLAEHSVYKRRRNLFRCALRTLSPRESQVVRARLRGETLDSIGKQGGVTRERIRQIEVKAHEKIRQWFARAGVQSMRDI